MKSTNREPEIVLIAKKIGRPAPDVIQTDHFTLKKQSDDFDINGLVNTIQNIGTQATNISNAISKTTASVTQAYNNAVGSINAGYTNIVQNTNPQVNAGYNTNTKNVSGQSLMPSLQLSGNPSTNTLLLVGLGIVVLAVVYSIFLKHR